MIEIETINVPFTKLILIVLDKTLKSNSITERFFRAPGLRTKYFERLFCPSTDYTYT